MPCQVILTVHILSAACKNTRALCLPTKMATYSKMIPLNIKIHKLQEWTMAQALNMAPTPSLTISHTTNQELTKAM